MEICQFSYALGLYFLDSLDSRNICVIKWYIIVKVGQWVHVVSWLWDGFSLCKSETKSPTAQSDKFRFFCSYDSRQPKDFQSNQKYSFSSFKKNNNRGS